MAANAAFLVGLSLGLLGGSFADPERFPFSWAHGNFYRAAQSGLEAPFRWPSAGGKALHRTARDLLPELLPLARRGLMEAGVDPAEASDLLGLIAERVRTGQTGAVWQRRQLVALEPERGRAGALRGMLERYLALAEAGGPVHTWPVS
jgi:hypothetical protein